MGRHTLIRNALVSNDLVARIPAVRAVLLGPMALSALVAEPPWVVPFVAAFLAYACWVGLQIVGRMAPSAWTTALDILAITVLSELSGGPNSEVSYAYFLLPIAGIVTYRAKHTAMVGVACALAYVFLIALPLSPADVEALDPGHQHLVGLFRGGVNVLYLLWFTGVCTLVTTALRTHERNLRRLRMVRERLLADVLSAEERERATLADGLHDSAIQRLLATRLELEDLAGTEHDEMWRRADTALLETVGELRDAVFELHPQVLDEAGLAEALCQLGARAGRGGEPHVNVAVETSCPKEYETLFYSVARELLSNVVRHARASTVVVSLRRRGGLVCLAVADDGVGLDLADSSRNLAQGHVGLARQKVRVESAGGQMSIAARPGGGTIVEACLPGGAE
ncbi:ATP-binding protein [Amycolatopsis sp. SID8362]|uniref:sensor histidine kinase n=1 Tax=Amycolatopsis sp. SID8362 TaxID=2690346 RepID=UPI00136870E2|nr:ATP-binding protein [Amycolatopsis sp. SID8362]NBH06086.1 hypothetical protein [Amycolatopsis sp. SID8362]NED42785.1 hypothetical protein [Amycolatopsis sp. SID8362]